MARAIWKARLALGALEVPVKLYSAVQDRKIHFRLLHAKDLAPVQQRWIRKSDGEEVDAAELQKAYPVDADTAVLLRGEELEELEPEASREIEVTRFVDPALLDDRWYDRPYFLGPDDDEPAYMALAEALAAKELEGVARWVMRKKRYVGALRAVNGYPMLITLRRSDQVISVAGVSVPKRAQPDPKELKLAKQLVAALEDDFDPAAWKDEYRERVEKLLAAKAEGGSFTVEEPRRRRAAGSLAESLRASVRSARGRKVA
jgi:DNA end-binding protein Ku